MNEPLEVAVESHPSKMPSLSRPGLVLRYAFLAAFIFLITYGFIRFASINRGESHETAVELQPPYHIAQDSQLQSSPQDKNKPPLKSSNNQHKLIVHVPNSHISDTDKQHDDDDAIPLKEKSSDNVQKDSIKVKSEVVYTYNERYIKEADEAWREAWNILHDEEHWKHELGKSLATGQVYSKSYKHMGRVSKLEGYIDTSPAHLYYILITQIEHLPSWSKTMATSKILERVTENIIVDYVVTEPIAGGVISSRDYVTVREWKTRHNKTLSAGISTTHQEKPTSKKIVRGINKAGGMMFSPVHGHPNKSLLKWSIATTIGGWIPQWLVDQSIASSMIEFLEALQKRAAQSDNGQF